MIEERLATIFNNFQQSNTSLLESSSGQNASELFHQLGKLTFPTLPNVVITVVFTVLGIVGLSMNTFVLSIMVKSTKIRTNPSSVFIMSLIVCNLLLCFFNIPLTLSWFLFKSSILTGINCKVVPFILELVTVLSNMTTSVIAVDRQLCVRNKTIKTKREKRLSLINNIKIMEVIIFISFASCVQIYCKNQNHFLTFNDHVTKEFCINTSSIALKKAYALILFFINFLIPSIALCSTLWSVRSFLNKETPFVVLTINGNGTKQSRKYSKSSVKDKIVVKPSAVIRSTIVTRSLLNVTLLFILSSIPVSIFNLLYVFEIFDSSSDVMIGSFFIITHFIKLTTAVTNSYFYGWLNPDVNDDILSLIKRVTKSSN